MDTNMVLGGRSSVLFIKVSIFQGPVKEDWTVPVEGGIFSHRICGIHTYPVQTAISVGVSSGKQTIVSLSILERQNMGCLDSEITVEHIQRKVLCGQDGSCDRDMLVCP